jgi:nitrate/TMAO reductase-like tetraheme cytochrome c subunit
MRSLGKFALLAAGLVAVLSPLAAQKVGDEAMGTIPYDRFEQPDACASCHVDITFQHEQAMMSQCFTHPWDEIEYFELALPHSMKLEKVSGVKAGCNGCHAPLAFLAGDIPPQPPSEGTRANESVSCDVCHSITGFKGEVPFNFNYVITPGETKQGIRSDGESPVHKIEANSFLRTAEFCGTCHNEKDPYGVWVKSTHLEWKESPHARAGIVCQDCHMPPAAGNSAAGMGKDRPDVRQHLFHGAHDPGKLRGVAEVRAHPSAREVEPGDEVTLTVTVVNAKAGHMVPSGSAEERLLWLHVEARDSAGNVYHLPVDKKGFEGEELTIASASALAYQDIGDIKGLTDFKGLLRDAGVPEGDRIFRLPYIDPEGRMTIAQWHTAKLGPDYRLAPLKAVNETYTFRLPESIPNGRVAVSATLWYSRLVPSVAEYLGVPKDEQEPVQVNSYQTWLTVQR